MFFLYFVPIKEIHSYFKYFFHITLVLINGNKGPFYYGYKSRKNLQSVYFSC